MKQDVCLTGTSPAAKRKREDTVLKPEASADKSKRIIIEVHVLQAKQITTYQADPYRTTVSKLEAAIASKYGYARDELVLSFDGRRLARDLLLSHYSTESFEVMVMKHQVGC